MTRRGANQRQAMRDRRDELSDGALAVSGSSHSAVEQAHALSAQAGVALVDAIHDLTDVLEEGFAALAAARGGPR